MILNLGLLFHISINYGFYIKKKKLLSNLTILVQTQIARDICEIFNTLKLAKNIFIQNNTNIEQLQYFRDQMKIMVKTSKALYQIEVNPLQKISTLFEKVAKQGHQGKQRSIEVLNSQNQQFFDINHTFCHYNIRENDTVVLSEEQDQTMESNTFTNLLVFSDAQYQIKKNFSNTAPEWRKISRGLNLEGICPNNICEAFKKKVWVGHGYAQGVRLTEIVWSLPCPLCKTYLTKVKNFGFYKARAIFKGRKVIKQNESIIVQKNYIANDDEKFLTFKDGQQNQATWAFIILSTFEL